MSKLKKIRKILREIKHIKEEGVAGIAPVNSVGSGNIAGAVHGESPPVRLATPKKRIPDFPKLRRSKPQI
jgi:hypothetical protein